MKTYTIERKNPSPNSRLYSHVVAEENGREVKLRYSYNLTLESNMLKARRALARIIGRV